MVCHGTAESVVVLDVETGRIVTDPGDPAVDSRTCTLDSEGSAWCWGYPIGADTDDAGEGHPSPWRSEVASTHNPQRVGDERYSSLGVGSYHACGITTSGTTLCWGRNAYSQLGNGETDDSAQRVEPMGIPRMVEVSGGSHHTCGISDRGQVWCWGRNDNGQLGHGEESETGNPAPVRSLPVTGS